MTTDEKDAVEQGAIRLRRGTALKLPEALSGATVVVHDLTLLVLDR